MEQARCDERGRREQRERADRDDECLRRHQPRREVRQSSGHPVAQAVADAADGAHVAGLGRVVAELAAQVPDVDVDEVLVAVPVGAPHLGEELATGERRPRPVGHRGEEVELGAGQVDGGAVDGDLAGCPRRSSGHPERSTPGRRDRAGPAQHRPDAGDELAR